MDGPENIAVWLGPTANRGGGQQLVDRVTSAAASRGHEARLLPNDSIERSTEAARAAIEAGLDRLVVIGGDGTVHQAVQAVAETSVTVGIVPAGTGNDFAQACGLPTDTHSAIDRALGSAAPFDLLRIGDRYGLTVATVGFSVDVNRRADAMRWPKGQMKYTVATVLEIGTMQRCRFRLQIDGEHLDISPNLLAIANTEMFGGGMRIAPGANPDDGQFDVIVIGPTKRTTMLRLLPAARRGGHITHRDVSVHRGSRLTLDAEVEHEVRADGEVVGATPIAIEVAPGALNLAGVR